MTDLPAHANDDAHDPLAEIRALRSDMQAEGRRDVADRLYRIEQSLQRRMTVHEAAGLTGEKPATLYQAIARGQLAARPEGPNNRPLIAARDLTVWHQRPRRRQHRSE